MAIVTACVSVRKGRNGAKVETTKEISCIPIRRKIGAWCEGGTSLAVRCRQHSPTHQSKTYRAHDCNERISGGVGEKRRELLLRMLLLVLRQWFAGTYGSGCRSAAGIESR